DIAICCGRNVRGSSPSTSVVPLSNQVTTLNHKRFKGFKMFSDGHLDFAIIASGCLLGSSLDSIPVIPTIHYSLYSDEARRIGLQCVRPGGCSADRILALAFNDTFVSLTVATIALETLTLIPGPRKRLRPGLSTFAAAAHGRPAFCRDDRFC